MTEENMEARQFLRDLDRKLWTAADRLRSNLAGEKDLALEQLDTVSKIPCGLSYGDLRLDSEWDSLRGDPRFEKIVASLAPKQ